MWGARANGWPEGKHLMLASNDPLPCALTLEIVANQWNPITHFHFILENIVNGYCNVATVCNAYA